MDLEHWHFYARGKYLGSMSVSRGLIAGLCEIVDDCTVYAVARCVDLRTRAAARRFAVLCRAEEQRQQQQ
jgi:hypothetical protein